MKIRRLTLMTAMALMAVTLAIVVVLVCGTTSMNTQHQMVAIDTDQMGATIESSATFSAMANTADHVTVTTPACALNETVEASIILAAVPENIPEAGTYATAITRVSVNYTEATESVITETATATSRRQDLQHRNTIRYVYTHAGNNDLLAVNLATHKARRAVGLGQSVAANGGFDFNGETVGTALVT